MNTILKEILSLPGVAGSCVMDKDQGIQCSDLPNLFTKAMAREVEGNVRRMVQMAEMKGVEPQTISISFGTYIILALSISKTSLLLILCKPGCNTSLVTTTAYMLAPELVKIQNKTTITIEYSPTDETPEAAEPPSGQVSLETTQALEHIKQSLFETVGPVAEMVFDDCVGQWTETYQADISRIVELVDYISTEINSQELVNEFKEKISSIL